MDFLNGRIRPLYFRYLMAAFGSAFISSIYSIVDMAMVGQYQGPEGTAALAVVAPVWNIIISLGLLMGIGGSVIFSFIRGKQAGRMNEENEYFSASILGSILLSLFFWAVLLLFSEELLTFFGADETLLPLAERYLIPIKFVIPVYLFNQVLAAFLRNDHNPGLATAGVLIGGLANVVGDYVFVFPMDMGVFGAGLATAIGASLTCLIMMTHFLQKKNTLRLVRIHSFGAKTWKIVCNGFSSFFIDVAMGILTILFNRQIMKYLGSDALAIYGPIINVSTFVQCCAYSVGQASQPIISVNFGAGKGKRIRETLRYALGTVAFFSIFWTALSLLFPNLYVYIFMEPTDHILEIAPAIIRTYAISFLLLPLNIFSTYYFQAILRPAIAFIVSVGRGLVISGGLILLLPVFFSSSSLWLSMPITELVIAGYAGYQLLKCTKLLKG